MNNDGENIFFRSRLEIPINKQRKKDKKSKLIRNLLVWSVPSRVEKDVVLISLYGHQAVKSCNTLNCLVDSKGIMRIKSSEYLIVPDTAGRWVQLTDKWRPIRSYPKPGSFATKLTASSASATTDVFLTAECEISIILRHINPASQLIITLTFRWWASVSDIQIAARATSIWANRRWQSRRQIAGWAKGPI